MKQNRKPKKLNAEEEALTDEDEDAEVLQKVQSATNQKGLENLLTCSAIADKSLPLMAMDWSLEHDPALRCFRSSSKLLVNIFTPITG